MDFLDYRKQLMKYYPSTKEWLQETHQALPFCSHQVSLSSDQVHVMEEVIQNLFSLKKDTDYVDCLFKEEPGLIPKWSPQDSVLMAYDFHIDSKGLPRLIEVNTNASGFLVGNALYQFQNLNFKPALESLEQSFKEEWKSYLSLSNQAMSLKPQYVVLIDENPKEQKMFIEFLMYKDFFKSMGWNVDIIESSLLKLNKEGHLVTPKGDKIDYIYNRSTDFYFEKHPHLLKAYKEGLCCISPHPREYFLLSNKRRLCFWFSEAHKWSQLRVIKKYLIPSYVMDGHQDRVWQNRKQYIFKPLDGHGGKKVYRGDSLTRKKWEFLCQTPCLYQEYISPSNHLDLQGGKWKLDFRAFVYRDKIQQLMARCYKGQITNFREPGSGWALVQVV